MPQTKTEITALLDASGLAANKRLGQHFLIDGNLMHRLVDAAEIERDDVVLEVGPGTGSLTEMLLTRAGHVDAVEVDRGLHDLLTQRLRDASNLTLLHTDVLETKSRTTGAVTDAVRDACMSLNARALLVANLPYHIASPLLVDLVLTDLPFTSMCFTVQREVAMRIAAAPRSKDYGPLSIVLQVVGAVRRIAAVPRRAFWPVPAVESSLLRMDLAPDRRDRLDALRHLNRVVKACSLHRRKTLGHNLRRAFPDAVDALKATGQWDLNRRPEDLSTEEWIAFADSLPV
jgi:16S rRNA (adenine1518-N6/adenine1519-N6)-dimethyltransferase